jgi:hypothetical protein
MIASPRLASAPLLALVVWLAGFQQQRLTILPTGHSPWPPQPEDIVWWSSRQLIPPGSPSIQIPAGTTQVVYEVPDDKWLVVTYFDSTIFGQSTGFVGLYGLVEVSGGVETWMTPELTGHNGLYGNGDGEGAASWPATTVLGPTFRPGSQVGLRNHQGGGVLRGDTLIVGYLVDA